MTPEMNPDRTADATRAAVDLGMTENSFLACTADDLVNASDLHLEHAGPSVSVQLVSPVHWLA